MDKGTGIRVAVALCWLGTGLWAPGGEIPVYRAYTRPIQLYGDWGEYAEEEGDAPDRTALKLLRDTQAQADLMGRETLFDLRPIQDSAGLAWKSEGESRPMPMPLPARPEGGRRAREREAERDWLVQGLTMKGPEGGGSNKLIMAASGDSGESGWGWLADELSTINRELTEASRDEELELEEESLFIEAVQAAASGKGESAEAGGTTMVKGPVLAAQAGASEREVKPEPSQEVVMPRLREEALPPEHLAAWERQTPVLPEQLASREIRSELEAAIKPNMTGWKEEPSRWSGSVLPAAAAPERGSQLADSLRLPGAKGEVRQEAGLPSGLPSANLPGADWSFTRELGAGAGGATVPGAWKMDWGAQPKRDLPGSLYGPANMTPLPIEQTPVTRGMPKLPANAGMKPGWY